MGEPNDFNRSFSVDGAISLDDSAFIGYSSTDPTTTSGYPAPVNSWLFCLANGNIYYKFGAANLNWINKSASTSSSIKKEAIFIDSPLR